MRFEIDALSRQVVPWLLRHRRLVLTIAAVLTLFGVFFTERLYADLRSDVEELLPSTAPSVVAAKTLGPKLHNVTHLSVAMEGSNPEALERFADDLAGRLRQLPSSEVSSVDYRVDEEQAFLEKYGLLYLSKEDLQSLVNQVDARVAWERRQANRSLSLLSEEEDPEPKIDLSRIEKRYDEVAGTPGQFRNGYFQTPDGHILAMLIRPPESVTGYHANKKLLDDVERAVRELDPHKYDPNMRVGYDGEVASLVEEQAGLEKDLVSSTVIVLAFVTLVLWLYYRRWSTIGAILLGLSAATAVTFGLGFFLIGHLNANTAFLGSIVVGNGINVSLIVAARYLEERRRGIAVEEAIRRAWAGTLTATFVASFGAGLSYVALTSTRFRGFNQFGVLGGLGMALCWIFAYLLLPPLLLLLDGHRPVQARSGLERRSPAARIVAWTLGHVTLIRVISAALLAISIVGILAYRGDVIEYDLTRLRTRSSAVHGTIYWGKKVDEVFRAYLTPIVIWAPTPAGLEKVVARLDQHRTILGDDDPIREVRTLDSIVPPNQEEKIPLIQHLQEELPERRIRKLKPDVQDKVRRFLPKGELHPVDLEDVPVTFRLPLTERNGVAGRIALAYPRAIGQLQPRELERITELIRTSIAETGVPAEAVGQTLLFADIARSIIHDGPRATALAFAFVCVLVILALRQWRPVALVLGSLLLGVVWLVGFAALARAKLNFLNFVVPPITFGIGVDYAVNIVQRLRAEGPASLSRVLRETGSAVALCSATTIIGYASLLSADNQALAGFGLLASLGEVACLTAALFALPAWAWAGLAAREAPTNQAMSRAR